MLTEKIMAILFYWDYTLGMVLGDIPTSQRIAILLERQGLRYSAQDVETAIQTRQDKIRAGELQGSLSPQTRRDIIHFYRQTLSILASREVDWAFASKLYTEFGYLPTVLYGDSLPTLQSLARKGFSLEIISNNAASARRNIEMSVGSLIDPTHIVISEEIGVHKPAKTIFDLGASRVGAHPQNCVYVGDNLEVDAIGAVRRGDYRYGLWIDRKGLGVDRDLPERVTCIISLREVVGFIQYLNTKEDR
jgi:FMN phosphatase YigB (HAD superfamily)